LKSPRTASYGMRRRIIDVTSSNTLPPNLLMATGSSLTTKNITSRADIKRNL